MPIYARAERARLALAKAEKNGIVVGERRELRSATARADEASKMHLVSFVPPYVPAKASRVYPALKTCTSPRRAAKTRQRAVVASYCSYLRGRLARPHAGDADGGDGRMIHGMHDHPARGSHDYLRAWC